MNLAPRVIGPPDGQASVRRTATFEPDLDTPSAARRLLQTALVAADRTSWSDTAALVLSEVVTNAALHAHTRIEVLLEVHEDFLWAEVRDGSAGLPQQRQYDAQATTGRGMALVAALTDECGVYSLGPAGKVVWFRLGDPGPEPSAEDLLDAWDVDGDDLGADALLPLPVDDADVVFLDMPATLWLAAREHHDALLRELVLYLAEHDDVDVDLPLADTARGLVSAAVTAAVEQAQLEGTARPVVPDGHPAPLPPVPALLELRVSLRCDLGPAYAALQDALDAAERLAVAGRLLARPGLPEVVAVRDWVCEQVMAQLAGQPALPWGGTAQARFETAPAGRSLPEGWDDVAVRESDQGVVAADEGNRIVAVSRSLAALLGWEVEDLVGRRVVTLIPPHLREAHVAGFTRHLTTGKAHVLGVPLTLPVLHADGTEVLCVFRVEQAPATAGRSVYVAWIEPVPAPGP
jgi:PAS domain S-box-containing protein